jgi:hypothetical protein
LVAKFRNGMLPKIYRNYFGIFWEQRQSTHQKMSDFQFRCFCLVILALGNKESQLTWKCLPAPRKNVAVSQRNSRMLVKYWRILAWKCPNFAKKKGQETRTWSHKCRLYSGPVHLSWPTLPPLRSQGGWWVCGGFVCDLPPLSPLAKVVLTGMLKRSDRAGGVVYRTIGYYLPLPQIVRDPLKIFFAVIPLWK